MSLPTLQEPVSWRIKLKWDVLVGLIGTIVEFHDRIQQPSAFNMLSFGKDSVAVGVVSLMICSHYPVNGHLIVLYITCIFVIFWQVAKGYGIVVSDTIFFVEFHLFTVLFVVAKLVLDSVVGITGSRLV